jgi:hypothetical protein
VESQVSLGHIGVKPFDEFEKLLRTGFFFMPIGMEGSFDKGKSTGAAVLLPIESLVLDQVSATAATLDQFLSMDGAAR